MTMKTASEKPEIDRPEMDRPELVGVGAVNVDTACRLLGIQRTLLYDLMGRGELQYAMIGRRRVVPLKEIQRFLESCLVGKE